MNMSRENIYNVNDETFETYQLSFKEVKEFMTYELE